MTSLRIGILIFALALGTGGCFAHGGASGQIEASADPMLVEINPGVWVIEDYSEPVFYVDGFYWLYRDDVWFRSSYHTGGWARVQAVPQVVVRIEQPTTYVRYRAAPGVRVRSGPRGTVIVREHRDDRNMPRGQPNPNRQEIRAPSSEERAPRPQPTDWPRGTTPDDKQDKRGDKQDKRDDKRDDKQDKRDDKQDKRDDKQDKRDDKPGGNRAQRDKHP